MDDYSKYIYITFHLIVDDYGYDTLYCGDRTYPLTPMMILRGDITTISDFKINIADHQESTLLYRYKIPTSCDNNTIIGYIRLMCYKYEDLFGFSISSNNNHNTLNLALNKIKENILTSYPFHIKFKPLKKIKNE